jgi:nitrite reductase (NO-forming)
MLSFKKLGVLVCLCMTGGLCAQDDLGKQVYSTVCIACHQPTGAGLPPVFPTLINTEYVNGSAERMAAIVLKGVMGPITVNGAAFNNIMPPQEAMLTDEKIAAVLSYVRGGFGNKAEPVKAEVVAEARKKFASKTTMWSEVELKAWPEEKK